MIQRSTVGAFASLAIVLGALSAAAQAPAPAPAPAPLPPEDQPPDEELAPSEQGREPPPEAAPAPVVPVPGEGVPQASDAARPRTSQQQIWKDIVVAPRKAVLKAGRFELAPHFGFNMNDPLITHFALGIDINYFLTDVLWIGVSATKYFSNQSNVDFDVRRTYRLAPRSNDLDYGVGLQFGYVPVYGKFTILNKTLIHWEGFVNAGVGIVHTTIIPRQVEDPKFSTLNIAPDVGAGGRVWLNRWISVWFVFRDYIYNDHFEPTNREALEDEECPKQDRACIEGAIDIIKDNAETTLVNNLMFLVGASFLLPTDFQYTTFK